MAKIARKVSCNIKLSARGIRTHSEIDWELAHFCTNRFQDFILEYYMIRLHKVSSQKQSDNCPVILNSLQGKGGNKAKLTRNERTFAQTDFGTLFLDTR